MANPNLTGWEVLYKLIENDIKTECDILVAVIHWFLVQNGGFRCIGIGDQVKLSFAVNIQITYISISQYHIILIINHYFFLSFMKKHIPYRKHRMQMKKVQNFCHQIGMLIRNPTL